MLFNQLYLLVFFSIWVDECKDRKKKNKKVQKVKIPYGGGRMG